MTTFTLQKERKEDQIRTYILIERNSGRGLRTMLLILLSSTTTYRSGKPGPRALTLWAQSGYEMQKCRAVVRRLPDVGKCRDRAVPPRMALFDRLERREKRVSPHAARSGPPRSAIQPKCRGFARRHSSTFKPPQSDTFWSVSCIKQSGRMH